MTLYNDVHEKTPNRIEHDDIQIVAVNDPFIEPKYAVRSSLPPSPLGGLTPRDGRRGPTFHSSKQALENDWLKAS